MTHISRKNRIIEAYDYLYKTGRIHSITELADKMNRSRSAVSRALSGNDLYLNEKFIFAFNNSFSNLFSLEYLLDGKGSLLATNSENKQNNECKQEKNEPYSNIIDALLDAKEETINALKQQLKAKDEVIEAKEQLIASLRQQLPYSQKECSGYMGVADKQY